MFFAIIIDQEVLSVKNKAKLSKKEHTKPRPP